MKNKFRAIAFLSVLFMPLSFSDRGMIPVDPTVKIFEPHQRAMIAWNGNEEILLLSTDLSASDSTMVLEVLPLPAEPLVKKGDLETFRKATDLINRKIRIALRKGNGGEEVEALLHGGEVTFHEKIGAHDISIIHLLDANSFVDWVKDYLDSIGITHEVISEEMKMLIKEYINDEFGWFVFDVVQLSKETVTNEPIQYRFKTKSLFYPLKITKTAHGSTSIELLILTPHLLQRFPALSLESIQLEHDPITINSAELQDLNSDMYDLLGDYQEMRLRIWKIEGELKYFEKDLIAR